jgi:hypothetical protein
MYLIFFGGIGIFIYYFFKSDLENYYINKGRFACNKTAPYNYSIFRRI